MKKNILSLMLFNLCLITNTNPCSLTKPLYWLGICKTGEEIIEKNSLIKERKILEEHYCQILKNYLDDPKKKYISTYELGEENEDNFVRAKYEQKGNSFTYRCKFEFKNCEFPEKSSAIGELGSVIYENANWKRKLFSICVAAGIVYSAREIFLRYAPGTIVSSTLDALSNYTSSITNYSPYLKYAPAFISVGGLALKINSKIKTHEAEQIKKFLTNKIITSPTVNSTHQ